MNGKESVQMIKLICKHDFLMFSWWINRIKKLLVIFKFSPKSHTQTLAEILKID